MACRKRREDWVPDPHTWNVVLMEELFGVNPSWAHASSISYASRLADDVRLLPPRQAQSPGDNHPAYVPTIPRMLNALSCQVWKCECLSKFSVRVSRIGSHLKNFLLLSSLGHDTAARQSSRRGIEA
jgi:hypothetical protein